MVNVYVGALLLIGNQFLMVHRTNVTFGSGLYGLIGGKVEQGETALQAIKREVKEETGLDIPASAFTLVHTLHRKGTETEFVSLVFKADISDMPKPVNMEPDKHDELKFFTSNSLPKNIIPAHKQVIECIAKNINYSEHGW